MAKNQLKEQSTSLKPNESQEGLEKVVGVIGTFILRVRSKMSDILYGAYLLQGDKNANGIQKALDRGAINLIEELSRIDFCNILVYLSNNKLLGVSFNPKDPKPLPTDSTFKKVKYFLQSEAFKLQALIDQYYSKYGTLGGADSRKGLIELVSSVNLSISSLIDGNLGLNNPEIRKEYPEVDLISNFLRDKLGELSSFATQNASTVNAPIDTARIQSLFSTIDKIRSYCVAIQTLNNPAAVIANIASGAAQTQLQELAKIIKPEKAIPLIYKILKSCNNINNVCRTVLGYVAKARLIIRLGLLLVKVFNVIMAFFLSLPAFPVPAGAQVAFSDTFQNKLKEQGERKLIQVLKQISGVLDEIYSLVSGLVAAITDIINSLNIIVLNLKSCKGNEDLIDEINSTVAGLEDTRKDLQDFIDKVNENSKKLENSYGDYTIQIVQEQLTDEGITLKRRYGIGIAPDGSIAVQSTPTFASLDLIIINEVKQLLEAKGLVKPSAGLSAENSLIAMYAMKYLDDNDISLDSIGVTISSAFDESEESDGVGLQSFINNLAGGKALRSRIRRKLLMNSAKLGKDLKSSDPNSKYTGGIAKQNQESANKLKIKELEDEKSKIKTQIALASTNPFSAATIVPKLLEKIRQIDAQIEALKKG